MILPSPDMSDGPLSYVSGAQDESAVLHVRHGHSQDARLPRHLRTAGALITKLVSRSGAHPSLA